MAWSRQETRASKTCTVTQGATTCQASLKVEVWLDLQVSGSEFLGADPCGGSADDPAYDDNDGRSSPSLVPDCLYQTLDRELQNIQGILTELDTLETKLLLESLGISTSTQDLSTPASEGLSQSLESSTSSTEIQLIGSQQVSSVGVQTDFAPKPKRRKGVKKKKTHCKRKKHKSKDKFDDKFSFFNYPPSHEDVLGYMERYFPFVGFMPCQYMVCTNFKGGYCVLLMILIQLIIIVT
jgi:hypothetical protein